MTWKFKYDDRTITDLYNEINKLAQSYTPEWNFEIENPDIGSTLAMVFASQMHSNIKKTNSVLDKYRIELVNLFDLSLLPAFPSQGTVVMNMVSETVEGTYVEKGTKLLAAPVDEGSETNLIFETLNTVYVTGASLEQVLAVSRNQGKIISFKGTIRPPELLKRHDRQPEEEPQVEAPAQNTADLEDLYIFDYRKPGIAKNYMMLYHDSAFDVCEGGTLLVRFRELEGEDYDAFADDTKYSFQYYKSGKFVEFQTVKRKEDVIAISVEEELDPVYIGGKAYQCIALEKKDPAINAISLSTVQMASEAEQQKPEFVMYENTVLSEDSFMPFGDVARLYSECYIGHNRIFGQKGATIRMEFQLTFEEKLVTMTPEEEDRELKVIKRKPRKVQYEVGKTFVDRVVFEYYNSRGWLTLPCDSNSEGLFNGAVERTGDGTVVLTFRCPEDMEPISVGAFLSRALRIRILQADNCYMQPCLHRMPVISNLELSYEYDGEWRKPVFGEKITGITKKDISQGILAEGRIPIFEPISCERDALMLGLSKKPAGEPFSLFFVLNDNVNYRSQNVSFEYSTVAGFRKLKTVDYTDGLRKTGTVMVMMPSDFAEVEVETIRKYWIRIVDDSNEVHLFDGTNPKIKQIYLNGINVRNVETKPTISYFIDNTRANLTYKLPYTNILSSEVFVNEKGTIPQTEIDFLLENQPEDIRAEYDYLGGLRTLFVRWTEVDNFDHSKPGDRHYVIDRMENKLIFGDGVNVRIPQASYDTALTVQVVCCDGAKANLPADSIQTAMDRIPFIGTITNPVPTYGGGDIEKPENALDRGAGMFSSKNRLVSNLDFERQAKANFDAIHRVKSVNGLNSDGEPAENHITMVVLTKEFYKGAYAFEVIAENLKKTLLAQNEYVLNRIQITEPIFVNLEVCIWIETEEQDKIFEIQNKFIQELQAFIDPITGCYGNGWDIGRLPSEHQLRMIMKRAESGATIKRYILTAKYRDSKGIHEVDYREMVPHPFMICTNGEHKVFLDNFK